MAALYWFGSKDVKELLLRVLRGREWAGQQVLDFPAGSGFTTQELVAQGAQLTAWDMFPEFFKVSGQKCDLADLQSKFPCADGTFDSAIFQEGIEHLPNQLFALSEFARVLKESGTLIVTTPNYSNFRSRLAYLSFESETPKMMPPNELESVWFASDDRVYFGHIFPIGIMKLRILSKVAGLEIVKIHPSRVNWTSFLLGLFFYPFVLLHAWKCYFRAMRKIKSVDENSKRVLLREIVSLGLHPAVLFGGHLIVEMKKQKFVSIVSKTEITQT